MTTTIITTTTTTTSSGGGGKRFSSASTSSTGKAKARVDDDSVGDLKQLIALREHELEELQSKHDVLKSQHDSLSAKANAPNIKKAAAADLTLRQKTILLHNVKESIKELVVEERANTKRIQELKFKVEAHPRTLATAEEDLRVAQTKLKKKKELVDRSKSTLEAKRSEMTRLLKTNEDMQGQLERLQQAEAAKFPEEAELRALEEEEAALRARVAEAQKELEALQPRSTTATIKALQISISEKAAQLKEMQAEEKLHSLVSTRFTQRLKDSERNLVGAKSPRGAGPGPYGQTPRGAGSQSPRRTGSQSPRRAGPYAQSPRKAGGASSPRAAAATGAASGATPAASSATTKKSDLAAFLDSLPPL